LDLLSSSSARQNAVAPAAATDPKLSDILSSMQRSVSQMQVFIDRFARKPNLDAMLHEPVLGSGRNTHEVLPVKLLREFDSAINLRYGTGIADFLSRLPSISVAGIAPPAADRLVRPELACDYSRLAAGITTLSSGLRGPAAVAPADSVAKLSCCTTHKWHSADWIQHGSKHSATGQQTGAAEAAGTAAAGELIRHCCSCLLSCGWHHHALAEAACCTKYSICELFVRELCAFWLSSTMCCLHQHPLLRCCGVPLGYSEPVVLTCDPFGEAT
jgi:hypothetical protein